ncbi:MAG: cysteine desulfurase [Erysipelotrichaceae bacterium]|nr:cysteine desulfurase [Erysipelotrichaceae bacterium]
MRRVQRKCYLDNASTTPLHPQIYETYVRMLKDQFYNCDALYDDAQAIARNMEKSRKATADLLNVHPEEVFFTSGASEANSALIKGIALSCGSKKHIITSSVEHSSVVHTVEQLRDEFGYEVTFLKSDVNGSIDLNELKSALRPDTCLVALMMVNNETGAIFPIKEAGQIIQKNSQAYFHVDGVQALGKLPLDFTNVDSMSLSAHKVEGLLGAGLMIKKKHVPMLPLINGGQQEQGLRGGTSNALVNTMWAKTIRLCLDNEAKYGQQLKQLHDYTIEQLKSIEGITINSPENSVPNIINFSYPAIPSEVMMNALNAEGIMVSAQSTCSSHSKLVSRVLDAMGLPEDVCHSCIRISISYHTQKDDIDYFINKLKEIIAHYG